MKCISLHGDLAGTADLPGFHGKLFLHKRGEVPRVKINDPGLVLRNEKRQFIMRVNTNPLPKNKEYQTFAPSILNP